MFSVNQIVRAIVGIIIAGIIFWLLWWLLGYVGLPEPFHTVARVILAVAAVLVLIGFLLTLGGYKIFKD